MGLIHAEIELANPRDASLAPLSTRASVDTGSVALCVPEHVAVTADGHGEPREPQRPVCPGETQCRPSNMK